MDAGRKWPETRGLTLSGAGVSACPSSVRSEQSRPVPWSAYSWAVTVMLAIVGPLIALAGVVAGLWLGQRQWKAEQARKDAEEAREQRDTFIENERRAYSGLWELTARTQEEMRGALEALTPQRFSGLLADLNAYMLARVSTSSGRTGFLQSSICSGSTSTSEYWRRVIAAVTS